MMSLVKGHSPTHVLLIDHSDGRLDLSLIPRPSLLKRRAFIIGDNLCYETESRADAEDLAERLSISGVRDASIQGLEREDSEWEEENG